MDKEERADELKKENNIDSLVEAIKKATSDKTASEKATPDDTDADNAASDELKEDEAKPGEETSDEETSGEETPDEKANDGSVLDTASEDEEVKDEDVKAGKKVKKDKKDELIEQLKDQLIRNMAEFDNFRKRTEKEKSAMFEIGARSIIEKLLPVIDNFERGFSAISEEEKESAFVKGTQMIYTQLVSTLEDAGVKPIEAVGKEFNTDYHNAVMHVDDENFGDNIVAEEFQKGYMYKDTVIRHSMVKVAN